MCKIISLFKSIIYLFNIFKFAIPLIFVILLSSFYDLKKIEKRPDKIEKRPDKIEKRISLDGFVLVTDQFSEKEKSIIKDTVQSWNSKTRGIVSLSIIYEPYSNIDFNNSVLLMKTYKYDPSIIIMDSANNCDDCTVAVTASKHLVPHIKIVDDRITSDDFFYTTVLHELGHFIGLGHLSDSTNIISVMYPVIVDIRKELTYQDLEYFCEIYQCSKEKREEILIDQSYPIYL